MELSAAGFSRDAGTDVVRLSGGLRAFTVRKINVRVSVSQSHILDVKPHEILHPAQWARSSLPLKGFSEIGIRSFWPAISPDAFMASL